MLDQPLAAAIRGDGGPVDGQDDYQYPCQDCFAAFKDQVNRSCRDVCSLQIDSTSQAGASLHPRQLELGTHHGGDAQRDQNGQRSGFVHR